MNATRPRSPLPVVTTSALAKGFAVSDPLYLQVTLGPTGMNVQQPASLPFLDPSELSSVRPVSLGLEQPLPNRSRQMLGDHYPIGVPGGFLAAMADLVFDGFGALLIRTVALTPLMTVRRLPSRSSNSSPETP